MATSTRSILPMVGVFGVFLTGCHQDAGPYDHLGVTRHDTIAIIEAAGVNDTALFTPHRLRPWLDGAIALDFPSQRVTAVDHSGQVAWVYSKRGFGPSELAGPLDGYSRADGSVVVMDVRNRKFLFLDSRGRFSGTTPFSEALPSPFTIAPWQHGLALVSGVNGGRMVVTDVATGAITDTFTLVPQRSVSAGFQFHLSLSSDTAAGRWIAAMMYGPEFWIGDADGVTPGILQHAPGYGNYRLSRTEDGLSRNEVGRADTASSGATHLSMTDGFVDILTGGNRFVVGQRDDRIDRYDYSGEFLETVRLPFSAIGLTTTSTAFHLLRDDPVPAIVSLAELF